MSLPAIAVLAIAVLAIAILPYQGPEPYDEVCHLCGTFSGAHLKRPDPPAAALPCPEPWPLWEDEAQGR